MKMEPIEGSETSAFKTQTPGNYPKENILHKEHGESLKSRNSSTCFEDYCAHHQEVKLYYTASGIVTLCR